jgi:trimeric autotransporter adhesin
VNSTVYALKVFDDGDGPALYAGGNFTTAGGVTVNRVAKWDGSQWSALGGGMDDIVHVLTIFDGSLHAAGNFGTADGVTVNHVARWDGSQWSALGSGLDERVRTLAVFDTNPGSPDDGQSLYAGGIFQNAGAVSASRIAHWDGLQWAPLGGGVNSWVRALAVFDPGRGPGLYAGGEFTLAGGQPASCIAEWRLATRSGPSDLTCDGVVDVLDLLILLDAWGECKDCGNCLGDLNNDCTVDVLDLLMLLDDWG